MQYAKDLFLYVCVYKHTHKYICSNMQVTSLHAIKIYIPSPAPQNPGKILQMEINIEMFCVDT